jgi:hypothetical protein
MESLTRAKIEAEKKWARLESDNAELRKRLDDIIQKEKSKFFPDGKEIEGWMR